MKSKLAMAKVPKRKVPEKPEALLVDLRELILAARFQTAQVVNAGLVALYWHIGRRIRQDILQDRRAEYGARIVAALGRQLETEFGCGFGEKNLRRMIQLAGRFSDEKIVAALRRQLGWTHFKSIIALDDPLKRDFYAEMCRLENWSTRTLEKKISGMLYERTALSKKPDQLIRQELEALRAEDKLTPDLVFRDHYVLDFLGLKGAYSENDLETAILRELESFLEELGGDWAFVARQKRITVDGEDFYLDLLFYHRRLRRLVALDLKLGRFMPADLGQMEFYLRWLKKHELRPGESEPLGLILCAEKSDERVEVLELEKRGVRVAEYLTELPPKKLLEQKLHDVVRLARARLEQKGVTQ